MLHQWTYLTGPPSSLEAIYHAYQVYVCVARSGEVIHDAAVFVIDPRGRERLYFDMLDVGGAFNLESQSAALIAGMRGGCPCTQRARPQPRRALDAALTAAARLLQLPLRSRIRSRARFTGAFHFRGARARACATLPGRFSACGVGDPGPGLDAPDRRCDGVRGDREADARAARLRAVHRDRVARDLGVDTDHIAFRVDQGPPELPGLSAASVWIAPEIAAPSGASIVRPSAETIPFVSVFSRP